MAVRNDNYGGDFNSRLQLSVQWLAHLIRKYRLPTELILVNYNPVIGREGLDRIIQWPQPGEHLRIRMITVPEQVHLRFVQPKVRKTVPLFEFIAKNIGIRRAEGRFILCTNADILLSEALVAFLSERQLEKGVLYRCNRFDFALPKNGQTVDEPSMDRLEERLRAGVFRFYLQGGAYTLRFPASIPVRLKMLRRYNGLRSGFYNRLATLSPGARSRLFLFQNHCHAGGDMTLLDRDAWFALRGYCENTRISTHVDSLQIMSARTAGYRSVVLPWPVYHQHHERRYDFSAYDPEMEGMFRRLVREVREMQQSGRPLMNEGEDWGLPEEVFDEWALGK